MMKHKNILFCLSVIVLTLFLPSCYKEIDLRDYYNQETENILVLNSLINPDSVIKVSATRLFFFAGNYKEPDYVKDLEIELWVNNKSKGNLFFNSMNNLYESTLYPNEGDSITIRTNYKGNEVTSTDVVPYKVTIDTIQTKVEGPMRISTDHDYMVTYQLTFKDQPKEQNFYFLHYDAVESDPYSYYMGERVYKDEFVFQQLARQVNDKISGWEPYSPTGLPFSDRGIDGKTYTLTVKEILSGNYGGGYQGEFGTRDKGPMKRKIVLYAISKSYYNYLISILSNNSDNAGLHGGLIDLGLVEPFKIYSNIKGGTGVLAGYVLDKQIIELDIQSNR